MGRLTQIAQQSKRQDGHTDEQAETIGAFQRWAEYENGKCDYEALRDTLAWSRGHKVSMGALQMHYEGIRKA